MAAHQAEAKAVIFGGEKGSGVVPVFKNPGIRGLKFVEHLGLVISDTGPENVMMRPLEDADGIDLDIAEVLDAIQDAGFPETEWTGVIGQALRAEHNCPRLGQGQRERLGFQRCDDYQVLAKV
jgi:hypothetical protein